MKTSRLPRLAPAADAHRWPAMRTTAMTKLVPLLALCLLTQGCVVGGGLMKSHHEVLLDPVVPTAPCPYLHERSMSKTTNSVTYTSEWLENHWGKPSSITHGGAGSETIWTYKFRPVWKGVVPVVLVPIPIAVPAGRERVQFVLRDGCVIRATQSRRQRVGGAAGFGFGPCGPSFGAGSLDVLF